jgi:hypothetical protein
MPTSSNSQARILIVGATGAFGERLVRLLLRGWPGDVERPVLVLAARDMKRLEALALTLRREQPETVIETAHLDRQGADLQNALVSLKPSIVIDAAGPFQSSDLRLPRAAMAVKADYLDLADSPAFVLAVEALAAEARAAGVRLISGASSVPALSGAVVARMAAEVEQLLEIDTAIMPGNRAPRGLSVIRGILHDTGRPIPAFREGRAATATGWGRLRRVEVALGNISLGKRWLSDCAVPDLLLFPARYPGLRAVRFQAGLELGVMHLGLWLLSWVPRAGLVRSLEPLARPLQAMAALLYNLGTDRGGMTVETLGLIKDQAGRTIERRQRWLLVAEAGDGPWVPAAPAAALARCLLKRDSGIAPGASSAIGSLDLDEILAELAHLSIMTAGAAEDGPAVPSPAPALAS